MTILLRRPRMHDPTDLVTKLEALKDAVASVQETFSVQFGMDLRPDGMPGRPDPTGILFGSTVALTNRSINYQFACAFDESTAHTLTRLLFDLPDDEVPPLEDLGDAMNEIPNVAAGVWKARREPLGEEYQLGLPLFLRGSGWLKAFPRGVNSVAQRLTSPDGLTFLVVLSWQFPANSEGSRFMSNPTQDIAPIDSTNVPVAVLQEAVRAVVRTCSVQMDLELEIVDNPTDPRDADVEFGSSIALTSKTGSWQLAVMCDRSSSEGLTRSLFAMEGDETPEMEDMADALGEIANVAAGVMKSYRAEAGQEVQLGLPLFMEGKGCIQFFASGIHGMAQTVRGPDDLEAHVVLIWQEG